MAFRFITRTVLEQQLVLELDLLVSVQACFTFVFHCSDSFLPSLFLYFHQEKSSSKG